MNNKDGVARVETVNNDEDYLPYHVMIADYVVTRYSKEENATNEVDLLNATLAPLISRVRKDAIEEAAKELAMWFDPGEVTAESCAWNRAMDCAREKIRTIAQKEKP